MERISFVTCIQIDCMIEKLRIKTILYESGTEGRTLLKDSRAQGWSVFKLSVQETFTLKKTTTIMLLIEATMTGLDPFS